MTRKFNQMIECPHCGREITAETAFCRWMRNNGLLESRDGIVRTDCDHIIHRFKYPESGRDVQAMMIVEVKTHGADLPDSQRDTLLMAHQVMRNRRDNIHKKAAWQSGTAPLRVYSFSRKRDVHLRIFGVHKLIFSGTSPEDSDLITWNGRAITKEILTGLIRMDLDPDTLKPIDLRIHQKRKRHPASLFSDF